MSDPIAQTASPAPPAYAAGSEPRRRGLGVASFVLGLLAVLGDVLFLFVFFAAIGSIVNAADDPGAVLAGIAGAVVLGGVVYIGGFVLGGISVVLGVIALILGRGRGFGIAGAILSLAVIVTHIAVRGGFDGIVQGVSGLPGIG